MYSIWFLMPEKVALLVANVRSVRPYSNSLAEACKDVLKSYWTYFLMHPSSNQIFANVDSLL